MELTVNQIKERQRELRKELNEVLNKFYQETKLEVRGKIAFGYTGEEYQHYVNLNYSNPFE